MISTADTTLIVCYLGICEIQRPKTFGTVMIIILSCLYNVVEEALFASLPYRSVEIIDRALSY